MKKTVALLLTIIIALTALAGCSDTSDVPSGMQTVRGSDALGYYLYVPDGWTVANQGDVAAAYVSTVDTTSVTLVEAEMPEGTIAEYFEAAKSDFTFEITVTKENADYKLGNATEAKQFIYEYKYQTVDQTGKKDYYDFRTMQIFAKFDGRFYIFTFTSQLAERHGSGQSYYDFHLENSLKTITDNIKFVKKSGEVETPEYPEVDGYLLVSKRELCGFDFFITKDYSVDFSDGIISVSREDGSNITIAKATTGGMRIDEYWALRKGELEAVFGTVTEVNIAHRSGKLGDLDESTTSTFEYTYTHGGVTYHVYQLLGVDSFSGYVFTFTVPDALYAERIDEALDIASRVDFK